MRSVRLVIRHEIVNALGKRSFWLLTILFPLFIIAISVVPQLLAGDELDQSQLTRASETGLRSGYVDLTGRISDLPPQIGQSTVQPFMNEAAAERALSAGEIDQYFLLPTDFLETGNVTVVSREFDAFGGLQQDDLLAYIVDYNLLGDASLARLVVEPTEGLVMVAKAPDSNNNDEGSVGFLISFSAMFILFFIISMTAGYMLQSVAKEKENRTVEVLLLSIQPRQLMLGKVLGLGVVGLVQMTVWLVGGSLALGQRGGGLGTDAAGFELSPPLLMWTLLYFLLGYLVYASLLGAVGALAPNVREGTQFTFILILPLLIPFWLNWAFLSNPDGGLALFFSLFPLSAPTAMVARLSVTSVPAWQLALSLAGLALTTYALIMLSARFFRADTLLNNNSLDWRRIVQEFKRSANPSSSS
ncbi:MAG: ABC transporter permease [Chloroflexi bacterium]|nr:ABC transporter permease [Chloroflexota bacterium]